MAESDPYSTMNRAREPTTDTRLDDVFEVLADRRRREVLRHLIERDPPVSVAELVDGIDDHTPATAVNRRELRVALHHSHLPKLDDSGFVDYDREENRIVDCSGLERMEPYLAIAESIER